MKKWYQSKTIWANGLAGIAVLAQVITGQPWLDAEAQAAVIVLVNLVLRIVTKKPLGT